MFASFRVHGFKSLADVELPLRDLTLLIGWNASGKSNVLEALELICWAARAPRLSDLSHAMEQQQVRIRGNLGDLTPIGSSSETFGFTCTFEPPQNDPPLTSGRLAGRSLGPLILELELSLSARGLRVEREVLRAPRIEEANFRTPIYETQPASPGDHVLNVRYQNFRRAVKPAVEVLADQPCFAQLTTPARFAATYEEAREIVPLAARRVGDVLGAVRFLDPSPRSMRGYAFVDDDQLHLSGDNVSAALHRLVEAGRAAEILEFVSELPEQPIRGIQFLRTPRNEVMVQLEETFGDQAVPLPAALMSDGTLRVLAVAAVLLSAPPGALVVIEEIDNGVHPSRAGALLRAIHQTARRRSVQVLITTHNPALQDALPDEVLPDVVLAWRDPTHSVTRLRRLGELDAFPRLAAAGSLGNLVTQQSFERLVKYPAPRQRADLSWLVADAPREEG